MITNRYHRIDLLHHNDGDQTMLHSLCTALCYFPVGGQRSTQPEYWSWPFEALFDVIRLSQIRKPGKDWRISVSHACHNCRRFHWKGVPVSCWLEKMLVRPLMDFRFLKNIKQNCNNYRRMLKITLSQGKEVTHSKSSATWRELNDCFRPSTDLGKKTWIMIRASRL